MAVNFRYWDFSVTQAWLSSSLKAAGVPISFSLLRSHGSVGVRPCNALNPF
jgi:hypothetical protein